MYPALAVLQAIRRKFNIDESISKPDATGNNGLHRIFPSNQLSVLWVGGRGGMEANLVKRTGVEYQEIPAAGVHGVGGRALPSNAWQIVKGVKASRQIIRSYQPDIMFFTGGYVAVPMALAGRYPGRGLPKPFNLLFVPDIEPGLALKTLARFADQIALCVDDSKAFFARRNQLITTGYPLRSELARWSVMANRRSEAMKVFDLSPQLPTLLVFGGSKGARSINRALMAILPDLLKEMQIIHICGQTDWPIVQADYQNQVSMLPGDRSKRYHLFAYLHEDMGAAMSAANLAVSRAGASILGELTAFELPAILVPYPYAWRYQQMNARYLERKGAALIVEDARLEIELLSKIRSLIQDPQRLQDMQRCLHSLSQPGAAEKLADLIINLPRARGGAS